MTGVRRADPADAGLLARLLDDFNREFATPTPGVAVLAERLRERLEDPQFFAFLAGDVGLAIVTLRPSAWFDAPTAVLDELYVAPAHRNRGLGTQLLKAAEGLGQAQMEINVDAPDADAQRFYERHGYTTEGARYYERQLGS